MTSLSARLALHPLWQLLLLRIRWYTREPTAVFWMFIFPMITSLVLGVAFRGEGTAALPIAVADGPGAEALAGRLGEGRELTAERLPLAEARERLRRGRVALVLIPGEKPELLLDPSQPNSRLARLLTVDALERLQGRRDLLQISEREQTTPGARYIDYLIPGLLGFMLMNASIIGVGYTIVHLRSTHMMKRMAVAPMQRDHFLLSFLLGRCLLAVVEIVALLVFARLTFGVRVFGSASLFFAFGLLGALCLGCLGLLIASRLTNLGSAGGIMNGAILAMMILSGVFFPVSNFPGWLQPILKVLPLTALNDGLRGIMVDGLPLSSLGLPTGILLAWGAASFAGALRLFRWT